MLTWESLLDLQRPEPGEGGRAFHGPSVAKSGGDQLSPGIFEDRLYASTIKEATLELVESNEGREWILPMFLDLRSVDVATRFIACDAIETVFPEVAREGYPVYVPLDDDRTKKAFELWADILAECVEKDKAE